MRRYAMLFAVVSLFLPATVFSQTPTPEAALSHFKNALKKSGKGDLDGAIEDYTRAITLSSRFDTRKPSGNSVTKGDASAEEITVVDPFTANAYTNRGLARFHKGDYLGAIADYNQALRIRPGLHTAYLNRAAAYRASGDPQTALKDLDRAIALKKDFFQAYNNRGSLHLDLGDTKAALQDLNRAIELNKDEVAEPFYQRGYTYLAMKEFDKAIADFERAIKLAPEMAWAYHGRGTAWMYKGVMMPAIVDYNRAIELDPKMAWSYLNRGLIWVFLGDESKAQKDFDECLRLRPELKAELDPRIDLARYLRRSGK